MPAQAGCCEHERLIFAGVEFPQTGIDVSANGREPRVREQCRELRDTAEAKYAYTFDLDVVSKWDTASGTMTFTNRYVLDSKGSAPDLRVTVSLSSSPLSIKFTSECHGGPKH